MNTPHYQPDRPTNRIDLLIATESGPEVAYDAVLHDFLMQSFINMKRQQERGGLLDAACFGRVTPWLYRLTFRTRGLVRGRDEQIATTERHVVALRFLPDYLRNADRFTMLHLVEPANEAFHPNISPSGAICLEIYPGETLTEICHSLHDLFRWRLRQYDERDALNPSACAWGREHVDRPIDDRALFGERPTFQWQPTAEVRGGRG